MTKQFLRNSLLLFILLTTFLNAQDLFTSGVLEYNNRNYTKAAEIFESVISVNPFDVAPYSYLVNCYIELEDNQKAIQVVEKATLQFPQNVNLQTTLGKLYVNDQRFDDAEKVFLEILKTDSANSEIKRLLSKINYNNALLAYSEKRFSVAIKILDKSLEYEISEDAYALKANSYIQLNKNSKANEVVLKGLKKYPQSDQMLMDYSLLLINDKKYDEAITKLEPTWKRNPNNLQIGLQLARLYKIKNKIKEAFEIYESLLEKHPSERQIYNEMISYYSVTRKEEEQRKVYERMEKIFPSDKEIILAKIKTYLAEEKDSIAIVKYSEFLDDNPQSYKAYVELAKLYYNNEMFKDGIALMNTSLANNQTRKEIYFYLGKFYYKNNQLELSLKTYSDFSELKPNDYQAYYEIGSIYLEQNKLDLAKSNFEKAIKINKNDALSLAKISKVYELQGDKVNTEKFYEKSLVKNIFALQKTEQLVLASVNRASNLDDMGSNEENENMSQYKDNINASEKFLSENLSNEKYLEMIDGLLQHYPQSSLLLFYKAQYYERIDNSKMALQFYERVIFRSTRVEDAYVNMAQIYYRDGKINQAILSYKRVLSLNPKNREMYKKLIKLYREDNRLDELCDDWQSIYESQPNNKILEEFLITALHKAGRMEEATEIINKSEKE